MNKVRTLFLFTIAIALGLGATWYANQWLQTTTAPVAAEVKIQTTPVVVAALEIPFGQTIEASHLKTINWPGEILPEAIFTDPAAIVGKIANTKIMQNELVINSRIVDQVGGSVLAAIVSPQMRAVTVRVNDVLGVAGFLLPGNLVDVVATRKESEQRAQTETILEGLKVLAVDQTAATDEDKPIVVRTVTLEVEPQQAERLVQASEEGSVQLILRNPTDDSRMVRADPAEEAVVEVAVEPEVKIVEKIIEKIVEVPVPVKLAAPQTITVVRGTDVVKSNIRI